MTPFEIFKLTQEQTGWPEQSPPPPPWRDFGRLVDHQGEQSVEDLQAYRGRTYCATEAEVLAVNAAIHLRRPLLLTGNPGCGKSALAYAVAWQLKLGEVLYWSINSQTTVKEGLYRYDAISRLRDANLPMTGSTDDAKYERIEEYLSLGPLGTALAPRPAGDCRPRILLIDELDKSDVDLPNDLLDLFEEGYFNIDELVRIKDRYPTVPLRTAYSKTAAQDERIPVSGGHVQCQQFPIVVITSNEERQFPPAFLRRCLRHKVQDAKENQLTQIVKQHGLEDDKGLIGKFAKDREEGKGAIKANDQLLMALFLLHRTQYRLENRQQLIDLILQDLKG